MIKIFNVRKKCEGTEGEYVLGLKDLNTHACYLVYGELKPGEKGRKLRPGQGHEEIFYAVVGEMQVTGDGIEQRIKEGEAFHFKEEETYSLENLGETKAVYVLAGGHSEKGH